MAKNAMFNLRDYTTADILNTPVRRGGILPVTEYPNRTEFDLSSGLTGALMDAFTAPARAARGEISEDQQIPEAFNFAGSLTLGSLLAPRPTGSVGMGGRAAKEAPEALRGYHGGTTQDWRTGLPYEELNSSIGPWSAFYSNSKDVANKFAAPYSGNNGVYPVDITMKNPRIVDAGGKLAKELQFEPGGKWDISKQDSVDALGFSEMFPWRKEFKELFSDPAYDGVIIKNTADEGDIYLPTKRGSVKSALSGETLFANAKTGAAVPLATRALEAQQPQGIRAFHGSPHDFDRFSMDAIGTGEGAQAYGNGLYFAEAEDVARSYRDSLSKDGLGVVARGWLRQNGGDLDKAIAYLRGRDLTGDRPFAINNRQALSELEAAKAAGADPGHMYEVRINANPEDFLDWDKPLSQQSEKVRNAVLGSGLAKTPFGSIDTVKRLLARERGLLQEAEQELSANRGMFGRSKLSTDQRDYYARQIEDSKARIDEFERILSGDATASYLVPQGGDTAAQFSSAMRDAGIPGIRYLDQMSRGEGNGSSNYVVFDDALVEILRKYGLLPPVAAGGLAAALGQEDDLY